MSATGWLAEGSVASVQPHKILRATTNFISKLCCSTSLQACVGQEQTRGQLASHTCGIQRRHTSHTTFALPRRLGWVSTRLSPPSILLLMRATYKSFFLRRSL